MVRLTLMQKERDRRGGPQYGGLCHGLSRLAGRRRRPGQFMRRQARSSSRSHIKFQAGLNEDLAATALWGTPAGRDARRRRLSTACSASGTARARASTAPAMCFRHANAAGTSKHGGVLVMAGDDHGAESSTVPHQSEFALARCDDPDPQPGRRAGTLSTTASMARRCRAIRACGSASNACMTRSNRPAVIEAGLDRVQARHPARLQDAAGRPQHPPE